MIGMLRGRVWEIQAEKLVLDVQGVGYLLSVPSSVLSRARPGQELTLYIHTHLREEELVLYGFSSLSEKKLFLDLQSVSGIGPKVGMAILSALGQAGLEQALAREDVGCLTKVPGVGKKTAQRLVLELKDKFKGLGAEETTGGEVFQGGSEAMETLLALGFSQEETRKALSKVSAAGEPLSLEDQIRLALKYLAG